MATASDGEKTPEGSGASPATIDPALESGRSKMQQDPGGSHQRPGAAGSLAMRSALHKPAEGEGGYDFSGSYDQTRRVRFKFGAHSLAVEATLAKLFESLTVECSGVLVQPQWKHFRHFDMVKNDQIRLSNGIWRSWHIKYQKGREPLFCTFDLNPYLNDHTRPEAVVLEGKYQRRKVEAVAREYRKWRMFHREKFRQGGCKKDPLLADLTNNLCGDELGGGEQAMQVEPPMPAGLIQLDELSDPFFMGLGQDYYPEYNASTNIMLQPKMDVLSSALDEFLGKLEPMEVLLSRTISNSNYQSPELPNFPNPAPFPLAPPTHLENTPNTFSPATPQSPFSQQLSPSLQPPMSSSSMPLSSLTDFIEGHTATSSTLFSPFSPPPVPQQSFLGPQQPGVQGGGVFDDGRGNVATTPAHTPPPEHPFHHHDVVSSGLQQQATSAMYEFTSLKRDMSSESLKSSHLGPSSGGLSPSNSPLTNPLGYSSGPQQLGGYGLMTLPGQPIGGSGVAMDTVSQQQQQDSLLSQQIPPDVLSSALDSGQHSSMGGVLATPYKFPSSLGGVASSDMTDGGGGGILGSKRKDESRQYLPGSKRRSPFSSQTSLPVWGNEGFSPGDTASSLTTPPGHTPLYTRRASIGSEAQVSDRPTLQKNRSEPSGSLLLQEQIEQIKLLSQQNEAHTQELEKQQCLAQQQYQDLLQQYKKRVVGQERLSDSDKQLLRTVLSKPALVDILRSLLSPSTSPTFTQHTPSPLLHTPSPTPSSSHVPPASSFLSSTGGGREKETQLSNETLSSPESVKVTEFQSRLLVAAAVQASGGQAVQVSGGQSKFQSSASNNTSLASTPEPVSTAAPFLSEPDLLSPGAGGESRTQLSGAGAEGFPAKPKPKTSRGLSSEQKEVYKEIRRQSHITAEQRRRGTIKQGFDQLQSLVVDPSSYPSGKVSKATVLEKTVEFIERAHYERDQREKQMKALRKEQEELNAAIAKCQEHLPASGVPVTRQRFEENRRRFQEYIQKRTLQNYKFWIYSIILRQLFESYNSTVSTGNQDELCRTVLAWFEQNCSLHALRPVVMNSLKELSTKTSILSDPSQVPHQLVQYAKQQLETSKMDS